MIIHKHIPEVWHATSMELKDENSFLSKIAMFLYIGKYTLHVAIHNVVIWTTDQEVKDLATASPSSCSHTVTSIFIHAIYFGIGQRPVMHCGREGNTGLTLQYKMLFQNPTFKAPAGQL